MVDDAAGRGRRARRAGARSRDDQGPARRGAPGDRARATTSPRCSPTRSRRRPAEGDVVVVTQKVVSKAEGRVAPAADRDAVDRRRDGARRRPSRRPRHRRDRARVRLRERRRGRLQRRRRAADAAARGPRRVGAAPPRRPRGAARLRRLGVVITDTFGRPWREGLVDVAIGVAGMPAAVDLRGTADHAGRELEVTVMALADQIAAAAGIVMGKAERVPAAVVRGIDWDGDAGAAPSSSARPPSDLFRESPLQALHARRTIRVVRPGHGAARGRGRRRRRGLHGARPASHASLALRRARRRARRSERCSARSPRRGAPTCARTARRRRRSNGVPSPRRSARHASAIAASSARLAGAPSSATNSQGRVWCGRRRGAGGARPRPRPPRAAPCPPPNDRIVRRACSACIGDSRNRSCSGGRTRSCAAPRRRPSEPADHRRGHALRLAHHRARGGRDLIGERDDRRVEQAAAVVRRARAGRRSPASPPPRSPRRRARRATAARTCR